MDAAGSLDLSTAKGRFTLEVANGDVQWAGGDAAEWTGFDAARLEIEHAPGEYAVRRVELGRGDASVVGEGRVRPGADAASGSSELEITLSVKGLQLPGDVPSVEPFGLSGAAEFTGVLSGTFAEPEDLGPPQSVRRHRVGQAGRPG